MGTSTRPRVSVHRSSRAVTVQLINDTTGHTVASVQGHALKADSKVAQAHAAGIKLAQAARSSGIKRAVFDRSGYRYHGRVKALAEGLREGGLQL